MTGTSHDNSPELCEQLTPREIEVLEWTAKGKTRDEISIILCISNQTVKDRLKSVCRKLDAINKTQAVALAMSIGLIKPMDKHVSDASYAGSQSIHPNGGVFKCVRCAIKKSRCKVLGAMFSNDNKI